MKNVSEEVKTEGDGLSEETEGGDEAVEWEKAFGDG